MCPCGFDLAEDGVNCKDVDECAMALSECEGGSVCVNVPGGHRCECAAGFHATQDGKECEENMCTLPPPPPAGSGQKSISALGYDLAKCPVIAAASVKDCEVSCLESMGFTGTAAVSCPLHFGSMVFSGCVEPPPTTPPPPPPVPIYSPAAMAPAAAVAGVPAGIPLPAGAIPPSPPPGPPPPGGFPSTTPPPAFQLGAVIYPRCMQRQGPAQDPWIPEIAGPMPPPVAVAAPAPAPALAAAAAAAATTPPAPVAAAATTPPPAPVVAATTPAPAPAGFFF